jgi:hypothetical protein
MGTTYAVDEPPALHLADLATIGRVGVEGYGSRIKNGKDRKN